MFGIDEESLKTVEKSFKAEQAVSMNMQMKMETIQKS